MNLPFTKDVPEFKARKHLGERVTDETQRQIIDAIDVIEQTSNYSATTATNSWNLSVMIAIVIFILLGKEIWFTVRESIGLAPQPSHAVSTHRVPSNVPSSSQSLVQSAIR